MQASLYLSQPHHQQRRPRPPLLWEMTTWQMSLIKIVAER